MKKYAKSIPNNSHVLKYSGLSFLAIIDDPVIYLAEAIKLNANYLV